jgi:hypothetical protein
MNDRAKWRGIASLLLLLAAISPVIEVVQARFSAVATPAPSVATNWSSLQRFTSTSNTDFSPAVVQGADGTVWVFYAVTPTGSNGQPYDPQIRYRTSTMLSATYNASLWSAEQTLIAPPLSQNVSPSVSQSSNGTIFLAFSSNRTGPFNIYLKKYNPGQGWLPETPVTWGTNNDKEPSVLAANDGSVWVFWFRVFSGTQYNLYYKVYRNGVPSVETPLTSDTSAQNTDPSALQLRNGLIWLAWSHYDSSTGQHIYLDSYNATKGTWTIQPPLSSTSNPDMHPAITEDENSTIWLSWSRELSCGGTCFQWDVFYKYSTNNGASWSPETNLTNDTSCSSCPDDIMSSQTQLKDGRIYLFWASTRDPQNYWNIYYSTTSPQPFHHISITNLSFGPQKIRAGWMLTVNVTVVNFGTFPESFFLFVQAVNKTKTTVAVQYLSLGAGQAMSLTILWNTNGIAPAKYQITAYVPPINSEITPLDNTRYAGIAWLVPPGDVNMDGKVDIIDASAVGIAYGSTPSSPNWNPLADLDGSGKVDILDASTVAIWYGVAT